MKDEISEKEIESIVEEKVKERGLLNSKMKLGLVLVILGLAAIFPVLGDVNIRDTGDLVLRDDTGLDLKGSTIDNVGAPLDSDDAVNKSYIDQRTASSSCSIQYGSSTWKTASNDGTYPGIHSEICDSGEVQTGTRWALDCSNDQCEIKCTEISITCDS